MENPQTYPNHKFPFRVPLSLIDTGGVIYNGRYFDIYNQARDEHMRDCGYPYTRLNREAGFHLAVVDASIQYKAPVFYDDLIEVTTKIEKIGTSSITFEQSMHKGSRSLLCNRARFVLVCTGEGFAPREIPSGLVRAYINGPA
ncbi:MAG: acyl-CoA thioesterase [Desulfarculaceae bacterium]|nr:acyl-CoA thioesterase [Desulfarculaceae bacterium]